MHHLSKLARTPAEAKLLVSGIHFDFIAAILQEDQAALLALNSSELKACPLWFVLLCASMYMWWMKQRRFFVNQNRSTKSELTIYTEPAIWQALSNVFLPNQCSFSHLLHLATLQALN
jgi:hypothetical protein